ncbi:hypothetical protein [Blastococcus saxobsidens]|uniref:Uncharacterized protein n=1 Tax=Blastococcus saxobsidens TaxID=138336 RepID=A0A4Q7Y6L8_9ACTN|nr:hypothetical protein [Blastococcus saxobsidens]RZU32560.1 hypothetical protein BKA19_2255 [Blastococcus saxobsidens]
MTDRTTEDIRALARPLRGAGDLDPLIERIGDARVVAIGKAGHRTLLQPLHLERADEHVPVAAHGE